MEWVVLGMEPQGHLKIAWWGIRCGELSQGRRLWSFTSTSQADRTDDPVEPDSRCSLSGAPCVKLASFRDEKEWLSYLYFVENRGNLRSGVLCQGFQTDLNKQRIGVEVVVAGKGLVKDAGVVGYSERDRPLWTSRKLGVFQKSGRKRMFNSVSCRLWIHEHVGKGKSARFISLGHHVGTFKGFKDRTR